jgi:hypothetical protein
MEDSTSLSRWNCVCYQYLNWKDKISTSSCHKICDSHSSIAEHQVFWYATLCCWLSGFCVSKITLPPSAMVMQSKKPGLLDPQDEGITILWNTGNHPINDTRAYPRRPKSSETFMQRFKIVFIMSLHFHSKCHASRSDMLRTGTEWFIHSVFCLTTGPTPLPKRFLHIVRSRASSFLSDMINIYRWLMAKFKF